MYVFGLARIMRRVRFPGLRAGECGMRASSGTHALLGLCLRRFRQAEAGAVRGPGQGSRERS